MRRDYIIANCKRVREKGIFSQFHPSILSNLIILIVSCCWLSSSSLHHFSDFSFPLFSLCYSSANKHTLSPSPSSCRDVSLSVTLPLLLTQTDTHIFVSPHHHHHHHISVVIIITLLQFVMGERERELTTCQKNMREQVDCHVCGCPFSLSSQFFVVQTSVFSPSLPVERERESFWLLLLRSVLCVNCVCVWVFRRRISLSTFLIFLCVAWLVWLVLVCWLLCFLSFSLLSFYFSQQPQSEWELEKLWENLMRQLSWLPGFLFLSWSESPRRGTPTLCLLSIWSVVLSGLFLFHRVWKVDSFPSFSSCYVLWSIPWYVVCVYVRYASGRENENQRDEKHFSLFSLAQEERTHLSPLSLLHNTQREQAFFPFCEGDEKHSAMLDGRSRLSA